MGSVNSDFFTDFDTNSNSNSVPILCWDFYYESIKELKIFSSDIKKIKQISTRFKWNEIDVDIKKRLVNEVIVITNPEQKIIFASEGISKMTGYAENEVIDKTPKMFQGPETSKIALQEIRQAIEKQLPFEKTLLNYKKNGETYDCKIQVFPIFNLKGQLCHFIAFEKAA
jgi:PAS domain S-box-containing protein